VPFLLAVAIVAAVVVHMGFDVSWRSLLVPAVTFVGFQIGAYLGAFWAGKWAREQGRFGPISLLGGLSLGAEVYIVIHYGAKWGILPSGDDDPTFFWTFVAITTAISWLALARFGKTLIGGISAHEE
jgi:hypothetical protein